MPRDDRTCPDSLYGVPINEHYFDIAQNVIGGMCALPGERVYDMALEIAYQFSWDDLPQETRDAMIREVTDA